MASNEHSSLQDPYIHNPKGYTTAQNNTVLTKGNSLTGYNDGPLQWVPNSQVGVTNYTVQGYLTGADNYFKGEDVANNKSPYLFGEDYGANTITTGVSTIDNSVLFRTGLSYYITSASTVTSINGYITSNGGNNVQIAICKITPTALSAATAITIIDTITVAGESDNDILVSFTETTITSDSLTAGDIIFPMIREDGGTGSSIYINATIQTTTNQ